MTIYKTKKLKKEITYFLRNNDIFSTTQRGTTTADDTGTFSSDTTHLIDRTNIKNIRSIEVDSTTLTYGKDYDYNIDYDDSGTIKTKITFTTAQTGSYTISYDYGTDKIFPDFPQTSLSLSSFPRIGSGIIDIDIEDAGFGGVTTHDTMYTIIVYGRNQDDVNRYIDTIKEKIKDNQNNFYYFGKFVRVNNIGPMIKAPEEMGRNKIVQQNIDIRGKFFYEK